MNIVNRTSSNAYRHTRKTREVIQTTVQTFHSCTNQPDVCQCLVVQTLMGNMSKWKPRTAMTHVHVHAACKQKPHSVVRSSKHQCQGNWVSTRRVVVCYARATQAFGAGIKCWHCTSPAMPCAYNITFTYE